MRPSTKKEFLFLFRSLRYIPDLRITDRLLPAYCLKDLLFPDPRSDVPWQSAGADSRNSLSTLCTGYSRIPLWLLSIKSLHHGAMKCLYVFSCANNKAVLIRERWE